MPTNREWLEHTEKAAWDTVQTLRRQIEEERERVGRLTPVRESWRRMVDALDTAKSEHGFSETQYADILDALLGELRRVKADHQALVRKVAEQESALRDATDRVQVVTLGPVASVVRGDSVEWFLERINVLWEEQDQTRLDAKTSLDGLLAAVERKVEELEDAPRRQVIELAVELGMLALRIAHQSRKRSARESEP
jgi:FtsZ-binding cell division protein ZapB